MAFWKVFKGVEGGWNSRTPRQKFPGSEIAEFQHPPLRSKYFRDLALQLGLRCLGRREGAAQLVKLLPPSPVTHCTH